MLYYEESRVFLTDGEKNRIYEANIANPPTVEVSPRRLRTRLMSSSFEKSPRIFSFVIALELVDFICQAEKPLAQYSKISVDRFKKPLLVKESKLITGCENKTVVIFSLEGGKTKTIEHKFKEPTAFLPVLDLVAVYDSSDCALVLFAKNGDGVLVVNCPKEISPIHLRGWEFHFPYIKHHHAIQNESNTECK